MKNTGYLMKKIIVLISIFAASLLYAEDKLSAGLTAGYQYDVGMISEKGGIQGDAERNISAGLIIKLDMNRFFLRSGVEYSYPFENGKITYNSAGPDVQETSLVFIEAPVYAGINLAIRDFGSFYIGGGGSYIFGSGIVKTSLKNVKVNEQIFGYGLIAGIESEVYSNASLIFEWEYMAARTSPVASASGLYDDYSIDYSGHRVRFGMIYHFNRY